jgi:hypothetical protein
MASLQPLLDSIRAAVKDKNWLGGLALTLMLPDICGRIETGERTKTVYFNWWADNFGKTYQHDNGPSDYVTGEEVYMLRCAYLHEGSDSFDPSTRKKYNATIEKFQFVISKPHHLTKQGTIVWLDAGTFCLDMCSQVENWEKNVLSKHPRMQTRAEKLLKIPIFLYPSGIPSTIAFGTPTVTQSESPPA